MFIFRITNFLYLDSNLFYLILSLQILNALKYFTSYNFDVNFKTFTFDYARYMSRYFAS